ncbi:MAG: flagellar basal-body rod protein FlgG [Bacillota bacterium]|nr:flagellar basal-body rod protein FlgG [Bacillota bacterium]
MKAMWSAASGMKNLQLQIDTTANNLANVRTYGFKTQRMEFKDIMYERISHADKVDEEGRPVPIEIGHGVLAGATMRSFVQGSITQTENDTDLAMNGEHFYKIVDSAGNIRYTKDGAFKLSTDADGLTIVTSEGYYLQGLDGRINLGENVEKFTVDFDGNVRVKRVGTETEELVATISLNKFVNPAGLESVGRNLYKETPASGAAIEGLQEGDETQIWQGYIENSNVQIVDEMINLITAERAYEINAKAIQTADRLMEIANTLKR